MNKRVSFLFFVCTITVHAFALKIPTGDNIRAVDAKEDEDAIVEVKIGGEESPDITTPLGKLKAEVGSTLYFYKSGALKEIYCTANEDNLNSKIETEIGSFIPYRKCTFYESGSLKTLTIYHSTVFTIGETLYGIQGGCEIEFHDSGNTEKFLVKKIVATSYNIDEEKIDKITYTNKSGTFIFQLDGIITFFMDGTIKTAELASSPNQPALVNNEEVFIASKYDGHPAPITFYGDGSIASFVSDELCMTKQGDTKLNIPAQTQIELWESGIIKKCACSNEITVKMKSYINNGDRDTTICYFNKDGSIRAVKVGWDTFADTFYEDGSIKRKAEWKWNKNKFDVEWLNPKGISVYSVGDSLGYEGDDGWQQFYPKDGDDGGDVAMVYFDDSGKPSSYSVFKKDDKGNIITDEFGFPLCEEEKKKLLNREEKNEEKKKRSK